MTDNPSLTPDDIAKASAILNMADNLTSRVSLAKIGAHITGYKDALAGKENQSRHLFGELVHTPETEQIRAAYEGGYAVGKLTPDRAALEASARSRAAYLAEQEYKRHEHRRSEAPGQATYLSPEDLIRDQVTESGELKCEFCGDHVHDLGDALRCHGCEKLVIGTTDQTEDIARAGHILTSRPDIDDPWDAYVAAVAQCRCGETGCAMAARPVMDDVPCPSCRSPMFECDCHLTDQAAAAAHTATLRHYERMTALEATDVQIDRIGLEASARSRAAYLAENEHRRSEAAGQETPLSPEDLIVSQVNTALETGAHPNNDIERAADIMLSRPDIDDPWDAYVAAVAQCRCGETGCAMAARPDSDSQNCPQCAQPLTKESCNHFIDPQSVTDFQTQIANHTQRITQILTTADRTPLPETVGLSL